MGDITNLFQIKWGDQLRHLAQQEKSFLENTVLRKEGVVGERTTVEQVGPKKLKKRTTRHAPTPASDPDLRRRWITMFDYDDATLFDTQDQMKTLLEPKNPFNQSLIMGANRVKDELIITNAFATAYTGKGGTTTQANTNQIASGGTGLTLAKMRQAQRIFQAGNIDPNEDRFLVIGPKDHDDLLKITEIISKDYNDRAVLVDGMVKKFLGFNIIVLQMLEDLNTTSGTTSCLCYVRSGLALAMAAEPTLENDKRPDLSNCWQAYAKISAGSARIEESKVIELLTFHS